MPRLPRVDIADYNYHVINRAIAKAQIFYTEKDYYAFDEIIEEAQFKYDMRIFSYSTMPNHWHFVINPKRDGDISKFMKWLTGTHTQRWHAFHETTGTGHIYQSRYKSFLIQNDKHLLDVIRYVENNPLRANLVKRAEDWKWSSLYKRLNGCKFLSPLPTELPENYLKSVNENFSPDELKKIQTSIIRDRPLGKDEWMKKVVEKFKLQASMKPRGRP